VIHVRALRSADVSVELLARTRHLLDAAFVGDGTGFTPEDWAHTLGGWHVVVTDDVDDVLAHAAVVDRVLEVGSTPVHVGYVEGVATRPGREGEGVGSAVMAEVGRIVRREHQMGALSTDRHSFYERLGWERWQGPTFVRDGAVTIRTADEDDGVMVLRFGSSASIALDQPLTCEARPGDDW
jgi:aminoglycoside 2'-N-acetyltransferase I